MLSALGAKRNEKYGKGLKKSLTEDFSSDN